MLQYMHWASDIKICEKNPLGLSCLLNFCYFSTHFWHFSVYFSRFYPDVCCSTHTTHLYLSHWTCNHTLIASNNVIFCMSCYDHSHLIISYLAQILGLWVTCGVKMMWLCHGWGWQPPQTASWIHIRHIKSGWAQCYAVHGHTVSALHSYIHPTWLRFGGSGSLVESKWCDYVMVEADSHLKTLPTSILNIDKAFEHIDMLSMGIQYQPHTVIPTLLGLDFGVLGHMWSQNDVIMSWLRLTATSNCFPHPY